MRAETGNTIALRRSNGLAVQLGERLARGGEGTVFHVRGADNLLAKVYHGLPSTEKQKKILHMVRSADAELTKWVAWPVETLHNDHGLVTGFVMPRVSGGEPLHAAYSSAHRRVEHPGRGWSFLVLTAHNVATAMAMVHRRGHVIGDVNQNGFIVDPQARVHVIDSDSFQIKAGSATYRSLVGVPEFTPPELQVTSSFAALDRTRDHDAFGLAVLIFQLLLAGRHPYSGRPLRDEVGQEMSADIAAFRYCHASDNRVRGLVPPPRAVPLDVLPPRVRYYFQLAFTETGVGRRPAASDWAAELRALLGQIKHCPKSEAHHYWRGCATCPWCALERDGVQHFVGEGPKAPAGGQGARALTPKDVDRIAREVRLIGPPRRAQDLPAAPLAIGQPLKYSSRNGLHYTLLSTVLGLLLLLAVLDFPVLAAMAIAAGAIILFLALRSPQQRKIKSERKVRSERVAQAKARLETSEKSFDQPWHTYRGVLGRFQDNVDQYRQLADLEAEEMQNLRQRASNILFEQHMRSCFLDSARIPGVGDKLKASLRGFGVETAWDVAESRVLAVPGVGPAKATALMTWRADCARRFSLNLKTPQWLAEEAKLAQQWAVRRQRLTTHIVSAPGELRRIVADANANHIARAREVDLARRELRQAEADAAM